MVDLFIQGGPVLIIIFTTSLMAWCLSIHCGITLFVLARQHPIDGLLREELMDLHRQLPLLATLASICPLLGLLGTVIGMVKAFSMIAIQNGPDILMTQGISQALLTTQAGLVVALPLFIFHRILSSRLDRLTKSTQLHLKRIEHVSISTKKA